MASRTKETREQRESRQREADEARKSQAQRNPLVSDTGHVKGQDEIDRPSAEERATMPAVEKALADPVRSLGEAEHEPRTIMPHDRMIRAPEQNPPLNQPHFRPNQPLSDEDRERQLYTGPAPTGADVEEGKPPSQINAPLGREGQATAP